MQTKNNNIFYHLVAFLTVATADVEEASISAATITTGRCCTSSISATSLPSMVHRIYPDISIIILSGYDNFEYVKKTLTNGALDYILKPTLNEEELLKVLDKAAQMNSRIYWMY